MLNFIPTTLPSHHLSAETDFSRKPKLTISDVFTFLFSSVSSGVKGGVRPQLQRFLISQSTASDLANIKLVHTSNLCRARYKIRWEAFHDLFADLVDQVYCHWNAEEFNYHTLPVVAVDGSQFTLPSSAEIREEFDPTTPLLKAGGRYFPQSLVMTAFDVFRKVPVARSITPTNSSERRELLSLIQDIKRRSLLVLDRGYFGYEVFNRLIFESDHEFLAKLPLHSNIKEVKAFVESGERDQHITINVTKTYLDNVRNGKTELVNNLEPLEVRIIRYKAGDSEALLVTSLLDDNRYTEQSIIDLYRARWEVENYYRDEKVWLEIEDFHSKKVQGVKQELYAVLIMSLLTRIQLYIEELKTDRKGVPQFLNAITTLSSSLPRLTALPFEEGKQCLRNLLQTIVSIRYYPQKNRVFPRVSRRPQNKWKRGATVILSRE